jgi:hypothetical protein
MRVWKMILKRVEEAGYWGFICLAADDLLYENKISQSSFDTVMAAVAAEYKRKHKKNQPGNALWASGSPRRIAWIKSRIEEER